MVAIALMLLVQCPVTGKGGDPALDSQKNRTTAPPTTDAMTVDVVLALPKPSVDKPKEARAKWPAPATALVAAQEKRGVVLTGYLLGAKKMEPETCNCHEPGKLDTHIWIGPAPAAGAAARKDARKTAVVVEMTPRLAVDSGTGPWTPASLEKLAGKQVRVTGWLMWDEEHPDEVGKTRATQWEVHPVTAFEVVGD